MTTSPAERIDRSALIGRTIFTWVFTIIGGWPLGLLLAHLLKLEGWDVLALTVPTSVLFFLLSTIAANTIPKA